jgi:N-acetyl-anhydromuramyl-L-alanine amidase AmpD
MAIAFQQARHFRQGPRGRVDLVVIHSAEVGETPASAEALMRACATNDRKASWHYAVDSDSITQSVREEDIAFHAPGANNNGIGIELSGRAKQSAADWSDDYSRAMLARAAELTAAICRRWGVPVEYVDAAGLLEGRRGITTHANVSEAFKKSDHTDPGVNFPMPSFLAQVRARRSGLAPDSAPAERPPPSSRPRLVLQAKGTAVVELQKKLNACGARPKLLVDGFFGELTAAALREFQRSHAIDETAAADDVSWAALDAVLA